MVKLNIGVQEDSWSNPVAVFLQAHVCSSFANLFPMVQTFSPLCPKALAVAEYLSEVHSSMLCLVSP